MKKFFLLYIIVLLFESNTIYSQRVAINDEGSQRDESAVLGIKSTTQGLLLPRLTNLQRDGMNTQAIGLIIFNTNLKSQGLRNFADEKYCSLTEMTNFDSHNQHFGTSSFQIEPKTFVYRVRAVRSF